MRKAIYSLVVAVYFLLSGGVVVQLHYCMDRLQEIGLFSDRHQGSCDDCGMDMNADNDCCQDRTEVIKLVQDQSIQQAPVPVFKPISDMPGLSVEQLAVSSCNSPIIRDFRTPTSSSGEDRYRYRRLSNFRI